MRGCARASPRRSGCALRHDGVASQAVNSASSACSRVGQTPSEILSAGGATPSSTIAAHAVAVAPQVLERHARAVASAPQVPARIAERVAHRFEIGDPRLRRVLRDIDAFRRQLARRTASRAAADRRRATSAASSSGTNAAQASGALRPVPRWSISTTSRVRRTSTSRDANERERGCRLPRAAGEDHERIRLRRQRVRGQHGDEERDAAPVRLAAVLGHLDRAAARRRRELGQPAFGELDRALAASVAAAGAQAQRRGNEQQRTRREAAVRSDRHGGADGSKRRDGVAVRTRRSRRPREGGTQRFATNGAGSRCRGCAGAV